MACEPLVVGPVLNLDSVIRCLELSSHSAETQAGEVPWTERRTEATFWFSRVGVWRSNRRWGPLAGRRVAENSWLGQGSASDNWWGSSLSLQGHGAALQAGRAGGDSAGCWAGVSRWVAVLMWGLWGKVCSLYPSPPPFSSFQMEEGWVLWKSVMNLIVLNRVFSVSSFVTYQGSQGLIQDCLRHRAESQGRDSEISGKAVECRALSKLFF